MYNFFNYLTYEFQILMQVLEVKEFDSIYNIPRCSFSVMEKLIDQIKTKAENVKTCCDQASGWVKTSEAVSQLGKL